MTRAEAKAYRGKIDGVLTKVTTDAEALEYADLYPLWSGYVDYAIGSIVRRPSGLYKCYNAISANPTWLPEDTAAHWERITVGEDGTIDNPITAAVGMRYYKDLYYLTDRISHVNKNGYDLAIEIHLNASGGTGSEVYYKHASASGKKLAAAISKSIANTFSIRDRGAKVKINPSNGTDYFGFVRSCKCESLLIETVFIDTASDRKHVETAAGQRQCAEAIVSAIAGYYGIKKKSAPAVKPSEDKPASSATVRAGDIVKIKGSKYATGQNIPLWVKLKKHTVKSVNGEKALLKEINSWVYTADLTVLQSPAKTVSVGSKVKIKPGATYGGLTAARGSIVPSAQLERQHTVGKIQTNGGVREALLTDISSWVAVKYLEVVG